MYTGLSVKYLNSTLKLSFYNSVKKTDTTYSSMLFYKKVSLNQPHTPNENPGNKSIPSADFIR